MAGAGEEEKEMTEYEKQRLARIRENKARIEALGLRGLASSLQTKSGRRSPSKRKKTKRDDQDEEEYLPSDQDENEVEEDDPEETSLSCQQRKGKKKIDPNDPKSSTISRASRGIGPAFIDDDTALAHAIALSLGESVENKQIKNNVIAKEESSQRGNTTKLNKSKIQLSETEVLAFFYSFDEVGKGYITVSDIEKMAIIHDFTWTDGEIAKMLHSFDSDGDKKLSLEDFRSIVSQCNMLQEPVE